MHALFVCIRIFLGAGLLFAAGGSIVSAQQRLDLPRYSIEIPAGWAAQIDGERWLIHPDIGANELGVVPVGTGMDIGSRISRDDARRQFWAAALGSRQVVQANPPQQEKDDAGRTWTIDSAVIEEAGVLYLFMLSVVELNGRVEGLLVVGTPAAVNRHQSTIESILNSVRPRVVDRAATPGAREKPPASGQPSPLGSPGPDRLAGVWTTTTQQLRYEIGGLASNSVVSELILFADGAALWGMPGEGLLGFDRAAHRTRWPQKWGKYQIDNRHLTLTHDGKARRYAVLADGALENRYMEGGKEYKGERFIPRPSLDKVRLDGEVRRKDHWPAPGTSGMGTLPGCTFSKDGTFHDEKLMWIVLPEREGASKDAHAARVAPGTGRYKLEHWTLVLEYTDGRVNQVSFVATDRMKPAKGAILNGYPIEPNPY